MSNSDYWINKEKEIVLIWSPKCACSTLHTGFVRIFLNIQIYEGETDPRKIAIKKNFIRGDYCNIPKNYSIYWGIRNPFDKIISAYINKFILYNDKRLNETNLEPFSKNILKKMGIVYNNLTFNKFLYGLQDLMSKNEDIDPHFSGQINLNNYNTIKNYPNLFIFDINNIPEIFGKMKVNSTPYTDNPIFKDLCDIKATEIDINNLQKKNFINSKELIKKIYSQDYQIFKKHNIIYL